MQPEEFSRALQSKARAVKQYAQTRFPTMAGNLALRFINGNFRAQGFQGSSFKKWKKNKRGGTILVLSGRLRNATYFTTQSAQATIKNNMPYAKAHNEGFQGIVRVKAHSRNQYKKTKIGTGKFTPTGRERKKTAIFKSGETLVKAHSRKMNIPRRQFIPTTDSPSPVLNNAIGRAMNKDLTQIINS